MWTTSVSCAGCVVRALFGLADEEARLICSPAVYVCGVFPPCFTKACIKLTNERFQIIFTKARVEQRLHRSHLCALFASTR